MKIIDCHLHTDFNDLMVGAGAQLSKVDYSLKGLLKEMKESDVVNAVSIGIKMQEGNLDKNAMTPMIPNVKDISILRVGGINPYRPDVNAAEKAIQEGVIEGLKVYLGYYPFYADDKIYEPFFELAGEYKIPVIFHTGDTYSVTAHVKYAKPLPIDEVAVKFSNVNFIAAHFGNPWVMDVAELLWKNKNVYADLSGLVVGDLQKISGVSIPILKEALNFANKYDRVIYGSDWPLVPMQRYIELLKKIVPQEHHEKVFFENAKKLFSL